MTYILCPGYVRSKNDGQIHYVGAKKLADLYRVNFRDCRVLREDRLSTVPPDGIYLHPRYDGDYALPGSEDTP
jgi:hypothetical protein